MPPKKLEKQVLELGLDDRATLAEKLILSLDAPSDSENLQLWVTEAERRLEEVRAGMAEEYPAAEVLRRARIALS